MLRADAKKIKILLAVLLSASSGESTPAQAMVVHCPQCLTALTPGVPQCSHCGLSISVPESAWSPNAIAVISFFFTLLPAGIMHAINYERLGHREKKKSTLVWVIVGFIVWIAVILLMPEFDGSGAGFLGAQVGIAMYFHRSQQQMFQQHLSRGGKKAPLGIPVALSFLWVVIFIGGLSGWYYLRSYPPLISAAVDGDTAAVQDLLAAGADVNATDNNRN